MACASSRRDMPLPRAIPWRAAFAACPPALSSPRGRVRGHSSTRPADSLSQTANASRALSTASITSGGSSLLDAGCEAARLRGSEAVRGHVCGHHSPPARAFHQHSEYLVRCHRRSLVSHRKSRVSRRKRHDSCDSCPLLDVVTRALDNSTRVMSSQAARRDVATAARRNRYCGEAAHRRRADLAHQRPRGESNRDSGASDTDPTLQPCNVTQKEERLSPTSCEPHCPHCTPIAKRRARRARRATPQ